MNDDFAIYESQKLNRTLCEDARVALLIFNARKTFFIHVLTRKEVSTQVVLIIYGTFYLRRR